MSNKWIKVTNLLYSFLSLIPYGVQIDYLVNNAGRSQRAAAVDTSVEVDQAVLDLNVVGTLSLTKAVLPEMLKRSSGMVVVISSVAGKMGELVVGLAVHGEKDLGSGWMVLEWMRAS